MTCQNIQAAISETVYGRMQSPIFSESVRAHLGECLGCRRHADETRNLSALMAGLPRVTAPADFDFKLRARIARAKAEQREPVGWFAQVFNRSFSWAQAGAAMAAVALVVGVTTYQFMLASSGQVGQSVQTAATVTAPQRIQPHIENDAPATSSARVEATVPVQAVSPHPRHMVSAPVGATAIKYTPAPAPRAAEATNLVAVRNTILIKGARNNAAQVVALPSDVQEVTYGAQAVNFRPAPSAQSQSSEVAAAVIF